MICIYCKTNSWFFSIIWQHYYYSLWTNKSIRKKVLILTNKKTISNEFSEKMPQLQRKLVYKTLYAYVTKCIPYTYHLMYSINKIVLSLYRPTPFLERLDPSLVTDFISAHIVWILNLFLYITETTQFKLYNPCILEVHFCFSSDFLTLVVMVTNALHV